MVNIAAGVIAGTNVVGASHVASPAATQRYWRIVDRLGKQLVNELLTDRRSGMTQLALAETYGISLSIVKRLLRHSSFEDC